MHVIKTTKKDLELSYFSSGKGGQHQNRHNNCVRMRHPESGVTVVGADHKELPRNMKLALKRLSEHYKYRAWAEGELRKLEEGDKIKERVESWVDEQMAPENIAESEQPPSNLHKKCKCKKPQGVTIWNCPICHGKSN